MRVLLFILLFYSSHLLADNLRIAVASNFYATLNIIKIKFEEKHSVKVDLIKDSTGKLFAQIKHGAPYDIFLAADIKRPELLEKEGLTVINSRYTYAIGQLAFWSKNRPVYNISSVLKSKNYQNISIANPKTAPYGQAALEALNRLELYNTVKEKLVYGENIAQAFQFVDSGSADYGFVSLAQVINKSSDYSIVPNSLFKPVEQQLVLLKSSTNKNIAEDFISFMRHDSIRKLIIRQGYRGDS
jgi:molybdate transport system substrate-binding protein